MPYAHGTERAERIAGALLTERHRRGLSLRQASACTGVPVGTLSKLERGVTKRPTLELMSVLAEGYGVNLDVVAPHHRPLLALDEDEVARVRGLLRWYRDHAPHSRQFDSIITKLEETA